MATAGLMVYQPDANPTTGVASSKVKPITEGTPVMVAAAQAAGSGGFWDSLDDLGSKLAGSLGSLVDAATEGKAKELRGDLNGATTYGDPNDQPGGAVADSFVEKHKSELVLAGLALASLAVLYWISKG